MAGRRKEPTRLKLEFADLQKGEDAPRVAVEILDRAGEAIHRAQASPTGEVSLPKEVLAKAHKLLIVDAEGGDAPRQLMVLRAAEVQQLIERDEALVLSRDRWGSLIGFRTCVEGSVSHCTLFPYLVDELLLSTSFDRIAFPGPARPPFRPRCEMVCDGEVIVYRRTCCCWPWVLEDPRLHDQVAAPSAAARRLAGLPGPTRPGGTRADAARSGGAAVPLPPRRHDQ